MSKNVLEILRDIIVDGEDINIYELPDHVTNWPDVEYDGEMESLDLENWEITKLSEESVVICAGGDWQEPLTFTLVPDETPKGKELKVTMTSQGDYEAGMGHDEILEKLTK